MTRFSRRAVLGSAALLVGGSAPGAAQLTAADDAITPPVFLAHAADDGLVPVANSVALFEALRSAGRPAALHVFEDGGHGFGTRLPTDRSATAWPALFTTFAERQDVFPA